MLAVQRDLIIKESNKNSIKWKKLRWLWTYFPIRYNICAIFFAYIFLHNITFIKAVEEQIIADMLNFVNVSSFPIKPGILISVGSSLNTVKLILPVYAQGSFLLFFPVVAITSRINFKMRARILLFGSLCFVAFIVTQFLVIVSMIWLGIGISSVPFNAVSVFVIMLVGSMIIELTLISTMTLPPRIKVKRLIKRSYIKQYIYLTIQLTGSFLVLYFIIHNIFSIISNSAFIVAVALNFNITTISFLSYFMSYLMYGAKEPNWFKWVKSSSAATVQGKSDAQNNSNSNSNNNFIVSFVLPANNEGRIIGRTIESIDRACSKYNGKTEIIAINDGSTDNTAEAIAAAMRNLKYSSGKAFTIPNSGKGFALKYGLERTSADLVFRIDADSVLHEDAINPMVNHFKDPAVGSVSGFILPLEEETACQKAIVLINVIFMFVIRRAQELSDSILVQSGAFSVFRRDALVKVGGWADKMFGEDGEITTRLARAGYRNEFEPDSIAYTEVPKTISGVLNQRARWGIGYFHARGSNLAHAIEFKYPRSISFLISILVHGAQCAHSLIIAYILASILAGNIIDISIVTPSTFILPPLLGISISKLATVLFVIFSIQTTVYLYFLKKLKKIGYIKHYPVVRFLGALYILFIRPQATEILLYWSSNHSEYNKESFEDLRNQVRRSVDPRY
jgi:cellulose synthase/poly-beta-1,6-N-acetylglucosamine synthase-like glycosyltransferase